MVREGCGPTFLPGALGLFPSRESRLFFQSKVYDEWRSSDVSRLEKDRAWFGAGAHIRAVM